MKNTTDAMEQLQKQNGVEDFEKIQEQQEDIMAQQDEINNFFTEKADEDKDDLLAELEEL